MKSTLMIATVYLVSFLMLTSCGKKRHNTEHTDDDDYDELRDTTERGSSTGPSGELVPIEKDLTDDDFKSLEAQNSNLFREILEQNS